MMNNKKGKGKALLWTIASALVLIVIFAGIAMFKTSTPQQAVGGNVNVPAPSTGGVNVYTQPLALTYYGSDKLASGTAVNISVYKRASTDSRFSLATNPDSVAQGTKFNLLFVPTVAGYHSAYLTDYTVPSSTAGTLEAQLLGNASLAVRVFNTDSQRITNGGGVNQTVTTGGAYNLQLFLDGQDKKSTQDMVCILEGDSTKIQQLTLSGATATYIGMAKPSSYVLGSVNNGVWVYNVAPVSGATSVPFTLGAQSKTGQSMAGTFFKVSCFTKEYFIDPTTGDVNYAIEDSNGLLKSMGSYTFTGYFS